jgi:hypothetical protein
MSREMVMTWTINSMIFFTYYSSSNTQIIAAFNIFKAFLSFSYFLSMSSHRAKRKNNTTPFDAIFTLSHIYDDGGVSGSTN